MKLKSLLFAALAVASMSAMAQTTAGTDELFIKDFEMKAGETATVEVLFKNATPYCALQADFHYPEGLKAGLKADGKPYTVVVGRGKGIYNPDDETYEGAFTCPSSVPANASMRIVYYQGENISRSMVPSAEGDPILKIKIVADAALADGTYDCSIDKTHYSTGIPGGVGDGDGPKTTFKIKVSTSGVDNVTTTKEVSSVKYINLAGVESAQPFDGVNVVVTTYTDGSKTTSKVVK